MPQVGLKPPAGVKIIFFSVI